MRIVKNGHCGHSGIDCATDAARLLFAYAPSQYKLAQVRSGFQQLHSTRVVVNQPIAEMPAKMRCGQVVGER